MISPKQRPTEHSEHMDQSHKTISFSIGIVPPTNQDNETLIICKDHPEPNLLPSSSLIKWFLKLNEFDIIYRYHPSIKVWAIVDFIIEFTNDLEEWNRDKGRSLSRWTLRNACMDNVSANQEQLSISHGSINNLDFGTLGIPIEIFKCPIPSWIVN